jgi:uncharacterized protein (DUF2141 family)
VNRSSPRTRATSLIATALSLGALSAAADPPTAVLTMRLTLRNSNGQVGCLLFTSDKGFPKDPNAAAQ